MLTLREKDENQYANAAEQLFYLNTRLADAIKLADIAIQFDQSNGFARRVKVDVYERQKRFAEALEEIELAIDNEKHQSEINSWNLRAKAIKSKLKQQR